MGEENRLERIEKKLDAIANSVTELTTLNKVTQKTQDDHESRIKSLESKWSYAAGAIAIIIFAAGIIISFLTKH